MMAAGGTLRPGGLAVTERAAGVCGFLEAAAVLDVGCGQGATLRYLKNLRGMRACGVDASVRMLSGCQETPVVQADAVALPFRDGCMDGVFCECVLSLLPRPDRAVREFRRVLMADGKLVLADVYRRNILPETKWRGESTTCLSGARSGKTMMMLLSEAGFDVILQEDHSWHLREFAARMVWALGSHERWMERLLPDISPEERRPMVGRACFGYGLWIARPKG